MVDPDVSYDDEERVEVCTKLTEYDKAKDKIINSEELLGDEKIKEHFAVFDVSHGHYHITALSILVLSPSG